MSAPARVSAAVALSCGIALVVACSSTDDGSAFSSGGASSGASSGGGTSNGGFGSSGTTSGASSGTTSSGDGGNCFAPVDMYIVFDKSGSMGEPKGNGAAGDCNIGQNVNSKWCRAINALSGYLNSASAKESSPS